MRINQAIRSQETDILLNICGTLEQIWISRNSWKIKNAANSSYNFLMKIILRKQFRNVKILDWQAIEVKQNCSKYLKLDLPL